ncbi:hypothetical protein HDU78_011734 [Chytriomyces hyalinus]|nr:hypothetical protein HDU78_011734 [Chytriomyces hyalinus]
MSRSPLTNGSAQRTANTNSPSQFKNDEASYSEDDEEDETYIDEIYTIIDAVVPRSDDPTLPALTFRVWVLGISFGVFLSCINTVFSFRTNTFSVSPFLAVLLAYPVGRFMARVLPEGIMNPGPFNYKEHTLIFVITNTMSSPPYALANIIGQKYQLYQTDLSLLSCFSFAIVTQCFGYGFAGLTRRYLVRPPAMLWPSNFGTIAMLKSLHADEDSSNGQYPISRFQFFWIVAFIAFVYEFLPTYVAPMLGALSVICWFVNNKPNNRIALMLGSTSPTAGLGLLSFTLDWSFISSYGPITTPLWAMLNQFLGLYFFLWIVIPILWLTNAFGNDQALGAADSDYGFSLNTAATYNKNGVRISNTKFVARDMTSTNAKLILNTTFYEQNKPIYITTYFALEYFNSFLVFTAAFVHVGLWYGKDIWHRFRSSLQDLDSDDIHAQMMDKYPDVPDTWYIAFLAVTTVAAVLVCQLGGFDLPWWGTLLAIALALVSMVPIGTIQAISGQQIGLNVMSEFLIGLILPGRIAAVMAFKTFSYMAMYQGLLLVQDLKLGHYIKIPPRNMFVAQVVSSILGSVISTATAVGLYESFGKVAVPVSAEYPAGFKWLIQDQDSMGNSGWSSTIYNVFISAGAIWGAIGPARFFGPNSPYFKTLIGFAVGLALPVIPWIMYQLQPDSVWHLVNIPLIAIFPAQIGSRRSDLITPLLVSILFNYFVKKYRYVWWRKYAYVLSAALDTGTAVTLLIVFFFAQYNAAFQIPFPVWFLNPADQERCLSTPVLECKAREIMGNAYGKVYNSAMDPQCAS